MSSLSPPYVCSSALDGRTTPFAQAYNWNTAGWLTVDLGESTAVKSIAVHGSKWCSSSGGNSLLSSPSLWSLVEDDRHVAKAPWWCPTSSALAHWIKLVPWSDKAGSQGVQPLVNKLFPLSGAIKRGHKGCNPLSTMRSRYLR